MPKLDSNILHHPAVVNEYEKRASDAQLRIADRITSFAGSMHFVYLHAFLFALWMFVFERSPWPTLTLIVSLEAIFLSTFVMIGQNRQATFQQAKADSDYKDVNSLLVENTDLTRAVHKLTQDVHESLLGDAATPSSTPTAEPGPGVGEHADVGSWLTASTLRAQRSEFIQAVRRSSRECGSVDPRLRRTPHQRQDPETTDEGAGDQRQDCSVG